PSGNSFSTSSIVIVKDPIAPEVLTKSITLELDASGKGTITSADIDNGSSDVCGIASLSLDKVSFDCSNIGDNVVSLTATDNNGNLTSASAMVTVVDLVAPEVFTKNITLELDASGKGTITSADIDNGSSDACGIASLSLDKVNFDCSNIGDNVVSLTVTDIFGNSSVETALVTITNETPVINSVSIPVDPQQINTNIVASVDFTDINISSSEISWGDGTSNAMEIVDNTMISSHGYSIPGVYTISILVTDICGQSASYEYQYVVIYDPSGGFVSGGGWINSLPGYFTPDPSLSGKATFGFVAKYKKGTNIPEGNTQFKFNSAGFQFESEAYDWLVVAGNRAKYKGNGMVNGVSGYFFLLTATDASDRSEVDRFRIKIWDSNDAVIYDNQPGAANDADTTNEIGGGSITVHDGKKSDNSSRIDLNNTLQVSVYPNPASSDLTLEVSNELIDLNPDYTISIFDVNGLIIYNRNYNGNIDSRINIDISKFSSGTYIIQFNNSKTNQLYKFFKQ
ncbi:MAG: T9SS type A sorting domain-containing protein, partial [Cyclobacteriaceae bacterium]|nr:T9SS type A sorting domain-containing protein [Cyclobacteriaceae bacterium]